MHWGLLHQPCIDPAIGIDPENLWTNAPYATQPKPTTHFGPFELWTTRLGLAVCKEYSFFARPTCIGVRSWDKSVSVQLLPQNVCLRSYYHKIATSLCSYYHKIWEAGSNAPCQNHSIILRIAVVIASEAVAEGCARFGKQELGSFR